MEKLGFLFKVQSAIAMIAVMAVVAMADDNNNVFQPCQDTHIQKSDGFTFGIAFSSRSSFFVNGTTQLSPCDRRLSLSTNNAQLAIFRPKVDQISLLTINTTNFAPVLEFKKGTLQNLYWKRDGCKSCKGNPNFTCLNFQDCAIKRSSCKGHGGSVDCSLGIQMAFSGTDKHEVVLNSWYEVDKLRQYSLYGLYSNLRDSLTSQFNNIF
ncbi:hypothetical protein AMTRI_Chr03g147480 [Amborella trichopoda]